MTSAPSADQSGQQSFPPASPPSRRLQRSTTDRMLGGVCGGLAEYTGIDVVLWRVGFVVFALLGAGVLVYLLLWILMPAAPQPPGTWVGPVENGVQRLHTALTDAVGRRDRS